MKKNSYGKSGMCSHVDTLMLVYLCVISGIDIAKDEKVWIPQKYIKLAWISIRLGNICGFFTPLMRWGVPLSKLGIK